MRMSRYTRHSSLFNACRSRSFYSPMCRSFFIFRRAFVDAVFICERVLLFFAAWIIWIQFICQLLLAVGVRRRDRAAAQVGLLDFFYSIFNCISIFLFRSRFVGLILRRQLQWLCEVQTFCGSYTWHCHFFLVLFCAFRTYCRLGVHVHAYPIILNAIYSLSP